MRSISVKYNKRLFNIKGLRKLLMATAFLFFVGNTSAQKTICSGTAFTYDNTDALKPGSPTFTWTVSVPSPVGSITNATNSASAQTSINQVLTNITNAVATITYFITNDVDFTTVNYTVTVNPKPTLSNSTSLTSICSASTFSFITTTVPAGATVNWTRAAVTGISNAAATGAGDINETLTNTTTAAIIATYNLQLVSTDGCTNSQNLQVNVNPRPLLTSSTAPSAICSGTAIAYTPTSNQDPNVSYTWSRAFVAGISNSALTGTNSINETLTNTGITNIPVAYVYTLTNTVTGCVSSQTVTISVNAQPTLSSATTSSSVCSGSAFTYTATSFIPTATITWSRTAVTNISPNSSSGTTSINEILTNASSVSSPIATYQFALNNGGCTNSQSFTVTVNPAPTLSSTLTPTAVCTGSAFTYAPTSAIAGVTYAWSRAAVTGISNPALSSTGNINETLSNTTSTPLTVAYVYTLTNPITGCTNTQTVTVVVNPIPSVSPQVQTICSGIAFTVSPTGVPVGTNYTWTAPSSSPLGVLTGTSGNAQNSITQTLTNTTVNVATATYIISPKLGTCTGSNFNLTVTVNPSPIITNQTVAAICSGQTFTSSPTSVPTGTTYSWTVPTITPAAGLTGGSTQSGQSSISQTLSSTNNLLNTAVYTVTPTANSCIGSNFTVTVPVNPVLSIAAQATTICSGNTFTLTPSTVVGTTYTWGTPVVLPAGSVSGVNSSLTASTNISGTLGISTTTPSTVTYQVTPTVGICSGPPFNVVVAVVNTATTLSSTSTAPAICSNTLFSYTPTSTSSSTTFTWTRAAITGISNPAVTGTGNPNEVLVNTTNAPLTVSYVYNLTSTSGCTNIQTVTVVVNPLPTLSSSLTPPATCSGVNFSYTATSLTSSVSYAWSRVAVPGISNAGVTSTSNVSELLVNTTTSPVTVGYVYTTTLPSTGCASTQTMSVVVNPAPVVANEVRTICSTGSFTVSPTGVPTGTTYTWSAPTSVPIGILTGTLGTAASVITQTLTNASLNPAIATYSVTPSVGGCNGSAFSIAVTVNPVPIIFDKIMTAICSGTSFVYAPTSVPVGTTYAWSNPVITPTSGLSGGSAETVQTIISQTLTSNNNILNTAVYTVTPTANNCPGSTFTVMVPVNAIPSVSVQSTTVCSGTAFSITPSSVPIGTTYTWTTPVISSLGAISGGAAQITGVTSISATLTNTTTSSAQAVYTVTPSVGGCAGTAFTVTVTVNPSTTLNSSTTAPTICSNTVFNYTPTSNTPLTTFSWTRSVVPGITNAATSSTGNPAETLINITNAAITVSYVYTLSTASLCTSTATVTVVVNPTPSLSSTLTATAVCSGLAFAYSPTSVTAGFTYSWSRAAVLGVSNIAATGNGNINETLINTTNAAITVGYVYLITNPTTGCTNTQTVLVVINPIPIVTNQVLTSCSNASFTLNPSGVPLGTTYTWATPTSLPLGVLAGTSGTGQTSIIQTLTNATLNPALATYTITPSVGGCIGSTFTLTVTVNPVPSVGSSTLAAVCSGLPFSYTPTGVPVGTTYAWSNPSIVPAAGLLGGSAQTGQSIITQTLSSANNLLNTATYTVTPTYNNCAGTNFTVTIPVNPVPSIPAQIQAICSGVAFSIIPSPVPTGTTYTWGAPVVSPIGSISGANLQATATASIFGTLSNTTTSVAQVVYLVTPTTTSGCAGTPFTVTVTVNPATTLNSSTTAPAICSNSVFNYTPNSITPGTTFSWTRAVVTGISNAAATGTGNPAETLINNTTAAITVSYVYTLSTASSCSSTATVTVSVNPTPTLSSLLNPAAVCSGLAFTYTPTSATAGVTYTWSRATVPGISNVASAGTGNVNEILINTTTAPISVGYVYTLTNAITGCTNTQTVTVIINPIPVVTNQVLTNCSATLFSVSPAGVPLGTTYSWSVPISSPLGILSGTAGVAQTSIIQTLTNASINPATATYTITPNANGCNGSVFTLTVTINPVAIIADRVMTAVCSGTPFIYAPTPVPTGTTYSWSNPVVTPASGLLGGGAQTAQTNISQTLTSSNNLINTAVYTVTPTTNSCPGANFIVTVPVNPAPSISAQVAAVCSGNTFTIIPTPAPIGTTYTWPTPVQSPFGSISGANAQATSVISISGLLSNTTTVAAQAIYTVTPNAGGCNGVPFTVTVTVNPATVLSSSTSVAAVCSNTIFSYNPTSNTAGTTFQWTRAAVVGISNPADIGTNSPNEILVNTTNLAINVAYVYTLTTPAGCSNTQTVTVSVKPTPVLTSLSTAAAICSGSIFNYTPVSNVTGTTFTWSRIAQAFISNIAGSGTNDPAEKLFNNSVNTVNVDYVYTLLANGCSNLQTVTVPVNPIPSVTNQIITTCSNTAFSVKPTTVPVGTKYTWSLPIYTPLGSITGGTAQTIPQDSISELLVNQTLLPASARYTVTPTSGTCVGVPFRIDVTVSTIPIVANQTVTVCSGTAFNFAAVGVPTGTTYTWLNPVMNPLASLTGGSAQSVPQTTISQTLSSNNNLINTATYTVTPFANGCAGNSFTLTVTINPTPIISNIIDTICTGNLLTVIPSPVPVSTKYTWALPTVNPFGSVLGTTSQVIPANNISQALINTTSLPAKVDYLITPIAGSCMGAPFTLTVHVGAQLATIPNQVAEICSGTSFNATPLGVLPGTTYTWTLPTITPAGTMSGMFGTTIQQTTVSQLLNNTSSLNSVAVYQVTASNTGCNSNIFNATITVLPVPKLTVSSNAIICRYPTDTITLNFTGKAPWSFNYTDDNSAIKTVSGITTNPYNLLLPITTLSSRSFRFTDIAFAGCLNTADTVNFVQTINNLPTGTINSLHGIYLCNNILDTLWIVSPDSLRYQWTLNGTNIPGAIVDSISTGIGGRYNAIIINKNGCQDTIAQPYTLIKMAQPVLKFSYDTYCINTAVNFKNLTDTSTTGTINWLWRFGDGNTATGYNSSNTYLVGGNHHIRLQANQVNCPAYTTTFDSTIDIQIPIAAVVFPSVSAYKSVPTPISGRSFPGYRYRWTPSAGINLPDSSSVSFNYTNTQNYAISLISAAGCVTKDSLLVRVFDDKMVELLVPKSFTPNGDGVNDKLYTYLAGIKEFKYFKIYNRYNQLMFETKNYDEGWDGRVNGTPQPMGIYIWVAVGIANDGSTVQKTGQTLLLR